MLSIAEIAAETAFQRSLSTPRKPLYRNMILFFIDKIVLHKKKNSTKMKQI